ncbi:MAG: phosphoribosylglycinamide formyltransferase [Desulfurella sp.]|jgi:phosphoribosylglycinamide formyltransferase-1|uniref:Phosphoribosylglycinamide formyltransferase n=2 Tax=Desulfurellaceae TaxID=117942 RepID=A0A1G6J5S4_9BACT|nr:MAG: phosphoribosylglycinamide formyltransferase [Desulfurella multipotens]PMP89314.1 MAG: phosphoribosylglycinamide formyltransferase [Desulfurella sp.]SDC13979.1 phosphoribosylglycinamide formyltransferase-1 [Desulfurella multipotens]HEX12962.1 phosphoribosylglycinamide formyltransferase [Desulfurella acetivorans]
MLSGRGSNFKAILDNIKNGFLKAQIVCVVSDKQCAGLEIAKQNNIQTIFLDPKGLTRKDYAKKLIDNILPYEPDLIVLAGFMRILDDSFVDTFEGKILNIHPSLLPLFKGLHPQKQAIEAGVKISGATVHFVTNELDSGPIIIQGAVSVHENDTPESLADRILKVEHKIYSMAIKFIIESKVTYIKTPQGSKAQFKDIKQSEDFIINPY